MHRYLASVCSVGWNMLHVREVYARVVGCTVGCCYGNSLCSATCTLMLFSLKCKRRSRVDCMQNMLHRQSSLSAACAAVAVLCRQTNVMWTAFIAGVRLVSPYSLFFHSFCPVTCTSRIRNFTACSRAYWCAWGMLWYFQACSGQSG